MGAGHGTVQVGFESKTDRGQAHRFSMRKGKTMNPNAPSYRLTFEDAVQIHRMLWDGWFQNRIAAQFDVNPGRISEVKQGVLHPGSYEEARRRFGHGRAA